MKTLLAIMTLSFSMNLMALESSPLAMDNVEVNKCNEIVTGTVVKVIEPDSPLYMSYTGDQITTRKVLVAVAATKQERTIANQRLATFTIHKPIAIDETYQMKTNNGVICSYEAI